MRPNLLLVSETSTRVDLRSRPAAASAPGRPPRRRHSSIVLYLAAGLAAATAFGTPSFQASTQAINTAVTNAIGLADLNGDGNLDAFFAIDGGARLFFGDGRGQLNDSGQALASGGAAAIADVNGDGQLEVLAGTTLWLNDGSGRLTARTGAVATAEGGGLMTKLADLNGDGRPDVFAIRSYTSLRVYLNDGNGNFADTGQRLGDVSGQSELAHFVLTDVDRNGTIDAIVGGWRSITGGACPNRVWLNDGAGNFRDSGQLLDEEDRHVHGMAVGDFNGDGSPDFVVGLQTGASHARIYLNDGAGRFTAGQGLAGSRGEVVTTGDFDGNGTVDVFVGASNTTAGRLWLNDGSATFLDSGLSFAPGYWNWSVAAGDFNRDGKPDLILGNGQVTSSFTAAPVQLWLNTTPVPPRIQTSPASQSVMQGGSVTFSVTAHGDAPLNYQWQRDGSVLAGVTAATLTLEHVTTAQAGSYSVVVSNAAGSATSAGATLTVTRIPPPVITGHPVSATVAPGGSALLTTTATATDTLSYQWFKDGVAVAGATASSLLLANLTSANAGDYTATVSSTGGTVTSRLARVTVATPEPGRLTNVSVRSTAGVGGQPLIVGLVVSGGSRRLLTRAVGPSLGTLFGLPGVLPDVRVDVHQTIGGEDRVVASNDDWAASPGDAAVVSDVAATVGAFGLPTTSRDAAVVVDVDGARTFHVLGVPSSTSGIVLVEAYDTGTANSPRLVNISTRNEVGTGGDVLIAGFVINGNVPRRLLVRGVGPALGILFGVPGVLADPKLELHGFIRGQDKIIAANDEWTDEPGAAAAAGSVGGFGLPSGSKDAALVVTLPAGSYSAVLSGVDGGTGNGLIEVYELPEASGG